MKAIPPALLTHLRGEETSLAICWWIQRNDGPVIRGTDHDTNIIVSSAVHADIIGEYAAGANVTGSNIKSGTDMSVDNMEVEGAIPLPDYDIVDITVQDIEAGVLDKAPVIVFFVNFNRPDDGQVVMRKGYLGEVARDSDNKYKTEIRGLVQLLSQNVGQTYGETCNVKRLGDTHCKLDISSLIRTGVVTAVTDRKHFVASVTPGTDPSRTGLYNGGTLHFLSGANSGFIREVKRAPIDTGSATVEFWEETPDEIQVGDTFELDPGCDKTLPTCILYGNALNFRGGGVFIPGIDALTKGPL